MKPTVLLMLVLSMGFLASNCFEPQTVIVDKDYNVVKDQPDQNAPEPAGDGQNENNINDPGDEPARLAEIHSDVRLNTADALFDALGVNNAPREQFYVESAPEGDNIHGSGEAPGEYSPSADIIYSGNVVFNYLNGQTIDDFLTCEFVNPHINLQVLCAIDREAPTSSRYAISWFTTIDPIPFNDETRSISLFWGYDSDGNSDNNFPRNEDYPYDFWQGLDRIHSVDYNPQFGWGYNVFADLGDGFNLQPSNSIMVIYENLVALILPDSEIDLAVAASDGGIHIHSGDWSLESSGANTAWAGNPQDPPQPFNPDTQLDIVVDQLVVDEGPDLGPLEYCGPALCKLKYAGYGSNDTFRYWCACDGCSNHEDCSCRLFKQNNFRLSFAGDWQEVAKQDEEYKPPVKYETYRCFCVKDAE